MIVWAAILFFGLAIVAITFTMTIINLKVYRAQAGGTGVPSVAVPGEVPHRQDARATKVAVCVPARNEEANLEACVRSVLLSTHAPIEVLVYDDQSTDATPTILARLAAEDSRVIAVETRPLPAGWNGKQHACFRMGEAACSRGASWLLFTDADVRFEPGAVSAALAHAQDRDAALVSTFPRQLTGSWAEHAVVPMIFFILFGYLPMPRMRRTLDPAASAGCGQFLFARADAYQSTGGHSAFKASMHDGIMMPRTFRRAGFRTDLFDGTELCQVRMYRGLAQTWRGFAKNAYEGLGSVPLLIFLTAAHLCGHVLPWAYLIAAWGFDATSTRWTGPALACIAAALAQRVMLARAFRHSPLSVALHPLGVLMMTAIQWHSLWLSVTGKRAWRGRVQSPPSSA
ncbi:MAG: glycosyltransferase family 2 protein [Phycisphaerales bacterium]